MGKKSTVPRGCKNRKKCKCGFFYYPTAENKYLGCTVCFPIVRKND